MSPYRVIVNGAFGKMGQFAVNTIQKDSYFELVGALGRHDHLDQVIQDTQADIVVDLTNASVAYENTSTIIKLGARPVIGTSGLTPQQIELLKHRCQEKKLGGIIVPNFSIGAVLMMQFAKIAARSLAHVEIIEAHHPQKLDAPSGTALKTAQLIEQAQCEHPTYNLETLVPGARGALCSGIPIHSLRLPGVLADQQIIFGAAGETLTLHHRTIDRECFMPGLILAMRGVMQHEELLDGLEHLLKI